MALPNVSACRCLDLDAQRRHRERRGLAQPGRRVADHQLAAQRRVRPRHSRLMPPSRHAALGFSASERRRHHGLPELRRRSRRRQHQPRAQRRTTL